MNNNEKPNTVYVSEIEQDTNVRYTVKGTDYVKVNGTVVNSNHDEYQARLKQLSDREEIETLKKDMFHVKNTLNTIEMMLRRLTKETRGYND